MDGCVCKLHASTHHDITLTSSYLFFTVLATPSGTSSGPEAARVTAASDEEEALEAALIAFKLCDIQGKGALSVEELWRALCMLSLDGTLGDESASQPMLHSAGGCNVDAKQTMAIRSSAAQPLSAWQRSRLKQICGDGPGIGRMVFSRLILNLWNRDDYDGVMEDGPGIDTNWAVTRHRFRHPGEHTISWHGLEHHAGCAPSNVLTINVMPRLPERKTKLDGQRIFASRGKSASISTYLKFDKPVKSRYAEPIS